MQDNSQAAAKWRRDIKRRIFQIANSLKRYEGVPRIYTIEEYPEAGPFLSATEARAWIELQAFVPSGQCHIQERRAPGDLHDVLRFVIAYADGALGDAPGRSDGTVGKARERLRKAERALKEVEEVLEEEVL